MSEFAELTIRILELQLKYNDPHPTMEMAIDIAMKRAAKVIGGTSTPQVRR